MALSPRKVRRLSHAKVLNARKENKVPNKRKKKKHDVVRGKEVTVRDSSLERQIIYGRMKVGGATSFISTNQDDQGSRAYLITGAEDEENQLVWTARAVGSAGNIITVALVVFGNNTPLSIAVTGNDIKVNIHTGATGNALSTATQVIAAIRANGSANALVEIRRLNSALNGVVKAADQTNLSYGGGRWLHQIITLATHQISGIEKLWLDNREVTFGATPDPRWATGVWTEKVFMATLSGSDDQAASPDLIGQLPSLWTDTDQQRGCAGAYVILVWNQNLFPNGYPEIAFTVAGKICYDPRTSTTVFTDNSALIVADYLTNDRFGEGIPWAEIDTDSVIAAANICGEMITIAGGGTQVRYATNGVFDAGADVLDELLAAMAGDLVYQGGKYFIYAGAYRTPDLTFTESDLRGEVTFTTNVSRREIFNSVRGTFADPTVDYNETDVPAVVNSSYITQDGGQIWEDIGLNFVTDVAQAQRLFKIALERVRQGISVSVPLKLVGLKAIACGNVALTLPRFGWNAKVFEVRSIDFVLQDDGVIGADLNLRENASGIFDWNAGEQTLVDLAPDTGLPAPSDVEPPSGLLLESGTDQLYVKLDGTVASRLKASWSESDSEFVAFGGHYELQFRLNAAEVVSDPWKLAQILPGGVEFYFIYDVQDGKRYDVRIRSVNTLGYESDWLEVDDHLVIGKTAPPSDVTVFTATLKSYGIEMRWDAITDLDADQYEVRHSGFDWDDATLVWRGRGQTFVWDFKAAGTYYLRIKAVDTTGNYSLGEASATVIIHAPAAPTLTALISGEDAILSWTAPVSFDFAIEEYELRYGSNFATGVTLCVITGRAFQTKINWGGLRDFFVVARDIAGNESMPGSAAITIANPNTPAGFGAHAISNNVALDWDEPILTSLPVSRYEVYKGDTFDAATLIGTVYGTFHTYTEKRGGAFTFWVKAFDSAGNESDVAHDATVVAEPENFYIRDISILTEELIGSLHAIRGGSTLLPGADPNSFFLPVGSTETSTLMPIVPLLQNEIWMTWAEFFISHGFDSMEDAIDAGYPMFGLPGTDEPGFLEFKMDYGVVFAQSFIQLTWEEEVFSGTVEYTPMISYSEDDITYTTEVGADQIFAEEFRYVKYRIDFQGTDDKALSRLFNITARLSLKLDEEYGPVNVYAADYNVDPDLNGTFIPLVKPFLDVQDIQVTIMGGARGDVYIVNFHDVAMPTGFRVLLYNISGTRINGTINRRIIGAVNPT